MTITFRYELSYTTDYWGEHDFDMRLYKVRTRRLTTLRYPYISKAVRQKNEAANGDSARL